MNQLKPEIIDTTSQVSALVDWLQTHHTPPSPRSPIMYLDLEGISLSRSGSLSILTILLHPHARICLVDVHKLGSLAFSTAGSGGKTLKDILQDSQITKVFFDVRNDSDTLFAHFRVALQGVEDVQLMESATRETTSSRIYVAGLAKCVQTNVSSIATWQAAKEKGERLFNPELGGSHDVFNQRPIPADIVAYCAGDVKFLPVLRDLLYAGRKHDWQTVVREATRERVVASQHRDYKADGPGRAVAPWTKEQNEVLDRCNGMLRDAYENWVLNGDDDYEEEEEEEEEEWDEDRSGMSGRDVFNDCDMDYYYSD